MESFTVLTATAAPLDMMNVDTDMIIPKQFLKTLTRSGLGKNLFFDLRFDDKGKPLADFVLNRKEFSAAKILLAGSNFGCGSSREHAPWALLDFGIRAIIAPSFADIFYNNCFKNGMLPVVLPLEVVEKAMQDCEQGSQNGDTEVSIDLTEKTVVMPDGSKHSFQVDDFRRKCLLEGLDTIAQTLSSLPAIEGHEKLHAQKSPWRFIGDL